MFGKPQKATDLYREQNSRNDAYSHTHEYRSIVEYSVEKFDLALNTQAASGWELVGYQVAAGAGNAPVIYATLRRSRNPR